jgi:mRNA interferase MazF
VVLLEQVRTLDKRRLKERMGHLDDSMMNAVNAAIAVSFGLGGEAAEVTASAAYGAEGAFGGIPTA